MVDASQGIAGQAASWSIAVGQVGKGAVIACAVAGALTLLSAFHPRSRKLQSVSFAFACLAPIVAMACLITLFVRDQFQYAYVFNHGDTTTDLAYKVSGTWSGQEGSFLLWAVTSGLFALAAVRGVPAHLKTVYRAVGGAFLGSVGAILAYETPFNYLNDVVEKGMILVPARGDGMTPSLQNYWMVIHPPTIFLGFGALLVPYALSVAAMLGRDARSWVAVVRPWSLVGLSILGLGLCMGGFWAYETLGWGGFWAWDPVENSSFVPWLFLAALIHGLIVQTTKGRWAAANLLIAGLPMIAFVYGTYLTRSGLLDKVSVHSFASMDRSALVLLRVILIAVTGGFLALWAWRGRTMRDPREQTSDSGISRENAYLQMTVLLSLMAMAIALGMSWPWISALTKGGEAAMVEERLYHRVVVWFFIPLMALLAVGPFIGWRAMSRKELIQRTAGIFLTSLGLTALVIAFIASPYAGFSIDRTALIDLPMGLRLALIPFMFILTFVCVFAASANGVRAWETWRRSTLGSGAFIAHGGLAMLMAGLILSRGFEQKAKLNVMEGETSEGLGYAVTFKGLKGKSIEDRDGKALFEIRDPNGRVRTVEAGLYYYRNPEGGMAAQTWPNIRTTLTHDLYLSLSKPFTDIFEQPLELKPGETKEQEGLRVTYVEPIVQGQPGQAGAKFGAKLKVDIQDGQGMNSYESIPTLEITNEGLKPNFAAAGPDLRASIYGLDAGKKTATVQLYLNKPIYPIELFTKPFTGFVWVGTGIMTLGGLMSAWHRRVRKRDSSYETLSAA